MNRLKRKHAGVLSAVRMISGQQPQPFERKIDRNESVKTKCHWRTPSHHHAQVVFKRLPDHTQALTFASQLLPQSTSNVCVQHCQRTATTILAVPTTTMTAYPTDRFSKYLYPPIPPPPYLVHHCHTSQFTEHFDIRSTRSRRHYFHIYDL